VPLVLLWMWQPQAARSSQKPKAKDPGANSQEPRARSPEDSYPATYCCHDEGLSLGRGLGLGLCCYFPVSDSASVALGNSPWDDSLTLPLPFLG